MSVSIVMAEIPPGYYDGTDGLDGEELRLALHEIIDNHTVHSYSSLWTHFQSTDKKLNNKVWDMYSDIPNGTPPYEYTFVSDQCGNYGGEGDCYNREHSWPKSWYNNASPMNTDLFQLVPTDGYVNGMRSNYPFGVVENSTWTSQNGSKRGTMNSYEFNGTVFEPIDEYKGDFARMYFYMSTRYTTEDSGWNENDMVNGADLKEWAVNMLLDWHQADSVSEKELNRNDAVYEIQGNRNPFIDHPEWSECIWAECESTGENVPPIANAGPDQIVIENEWITLSGIESSDFENDNLFFLWASPLGIELDDSTSGTPSFMAPAVDDTTNLIFSLVVSDGDLNSNPDSVQITVTNSLIIESNALPNKFALFTPFPNPFNPTSTIRFNIPFETQENTFLQIIDLKGDLVETLVNGDYLTGKNQVQWNASRHPSGIYFAVLQFGKKSTSRKLIYLK
ncbi:endonuclease [bacterium]|nr:endonuclease [bacterium]MDC1037522.1 endonuclease [Candidatus Neomarinimicrobiota bacterium]